MSPRDGNRPSVEERRGSFLDRFARLAGRGREETAPVALHTAVLLPIAVFVGIVIAICLVIWLTLR
jgi:hypothetical protein